MKNRNSASRQLSHSAVRVFLAGAMALVLTHSAQAGLTHRYSFTNDVTDSVGGAPGTLMGNVTISNQAAVFPGASTLDYVELPPGLISNYTSVTFEFWANVGANGTWEEIYAFGNQSGTAGANMLMFTPHSGGPDFRMSYAQADPGYNDEYVVVGTPILDNQGPRHVTCVYDPPNMAMRLYTNGVLVSATPNRALPANYSLANIYNVYSWLGRSLYGPDPAFNGTIDEFRIYDAPLTAFDIAVNDAAGPDLYVSSAGALASAKVAPASTNMFTGSTQAARLLAAFANISNVNVTAWASNWTSLNPTIASVDANGIVTGLDDGTATIQATFGGITGSASIRVIGVVGSLDLQVNPDMVAGGARTFHLIAAYTNGSSADATASATFTSSASNVVNFIAVGRLAAWTAGSAVITATYRGVTTNKTVNVSNMSMTHRWSFNDAAYLPDGVTPNTNVVDSIAGANGQLLNDCSLLGDGTAGFGGLGGHVILPPNLFTNYGAVTFETWVTDSGSAGWARLYDFGNSVNGPGQQGGGTQYMFLSLPSGGGVLRGAYTITGGGAGEQTVQMNGRPAAGIKTHIVWTTSGAAHTGWLYVDGVLVGTNASVTLTPEDMGPTSNDWLGKSQYNDPYFYGAMDEFRVYNGVLDPLSIALDTATGPDIITNNPGACTGLTLTLNSPMNEQDSQPMVLIGTFANLPNPLPMTTLPQVTYSSSNTRVATVNALGVVTAVGPGNATVTASAFGQTANMPLTVVAVPVTLTHRWNFNDAPGSGTVADSIAAADGVILGNVTQTGTEAVFDGAGSYIQLPPDLFTTYNSITFEAWYTDTGTATWGRLLDIGNNTSHYMFLCANPTRGAYNAGAGEGANVLSVTRPATGVQHHIVFTQDALSQTAKMYIDGMLVGQNFTFTIRPKDVGTTQLAYIGKSQYNDPYFTGRMNELRTWQGAISPLQVAIDYAAGPNQVVASPGAVQTVTITATNMVAGRVQQAIASANFAAVSSVPVTAYATNWTSSDLTVAKVDRLGGITAIGPGTAIISATFGGITGNLNLTVTAAPAPVLAHRYSFTTDTTDSVGGANGTLLGNAVIANGSVVLDGTTNTYVQLPGGLFDGFNEVTFEAWFTYPTTLAGNARLWDFGTTVASTNYIGYIPLNGSANSQVRYNPGSEANLTMPGATGMSYNTNLVHVAVTLSPLSGLAKLYVDGQWKETFGWTRPLAQFTNTVGFLGHAVTLTSPPGNFTGSISEFRIYNGALDQLQVEASYAAGPDTLATDPGAVQSVSIVLNDPTMVQGTLQRPRVSATFANLASPLDLTAYPGLQLSSDNTAVAKVTGDDRISGVGTGTAHIIASYGGKSASAALTVGPKALTLTHQYTFRRDGSDSVGKADATLWGKAAIVNGAVVLDGTRNPQSFVQLPRDLISGFDAMTIEAWVSVGASGSTWERLWDFGNHTNATGVNYIYQSPYSGAGGNPNRLGLSANAVPIAEVDADNPGLRGQTVHLVSVVDSAAGTMKVYTNGVLASTFSGPTPVALTAIEDVYNYIGRSQFNDNWFIGGLNEFRIWYGAMSAAQVAASYGAGPVPDLVSLTLTPSGSNVIISWPAAGTASLKLKYSPVLGPGAVWNQVPGTPSVAGGNYEVTIPISGQAVFFLLGN